MRLLRLATASLFLAAHCCRAEETAAPYSAAACTAAKQKIIAKVLQLLHRFDIIKIKNLMFLNVLILNIFNYLSWRCMYLLALSQKQSLPMFPWMATSKWDKTIFTLLVSLILQYLVHKLN